MLLPMRADRALILPIGVLLFASVAVAVSRSGGAPVSPEALPTVSVSPSSSAPPSAASSPTPVLSSVPSPSPSLAPETTGPATPHASIPPGEVNQNPGEPGVSPVKQEPGLPRTGGDDRRTAGFALVALAAVLAGALRRNHRRLPASR